MKKLLETGRTDLLERFISRKVRPFKAFLVLTDKKTLVLNSKSASRSRKENASPKSLRRKLISLEWNQWAYVPSAVAKLSKLKTVIFANVRRQIERPANSS